MIAINFKVERGGRRLKNNREELAKPFLKNELTEEEKFKILQSKIIDKKVKKYLMNKLNNLHIEVLGKCEGSLFDLMYERNLEGWCWQTTESAIIFLNDDDYIERGDLRFDEKRSKYYHAWICFKFSGIEYVLDPCLSILCKKSDYSKIFECNVKGKVSAKAIEEELIRQVTAPKNKDTSKVHQAFQSFLKSSMGESYDSYIESKKEEVIVHGPEDVNAPLYRNGAGYKTEIENGKVKKLTVHYYYTDC